MSFNCKSTFAFYQIKAKYTSESGLPQNSVKSIAEDDFGFIWLTTESGIVRYDGKNFRLFDKFDDISITRTYNIFKIDNRLFVVDENKSIFEIKSGFLRKAELDRDQKSTLISNSIYKRLHFGFGITRETFYKRHVAELLLDIDHTVTITRDSIIWRYNDIPVKATAIKIKKPIASQFFVLDKKLYCIDFDKGNTLYRITPEAHIPVAIWGDLKEKPLNRDLVIWENQGSLQSFIYIDNCLYLLESNGDGSVSSKSILSNYKLDRHNIKSIFYNDTKHLLFIGSLIDGFSVFYKKQFSVLDVVDSQTSNSVFYDIIPYNENEIISGSGIVLNYLQGGAYIPERLRRYGLLNTSLLMKTQSGEFLFGTNNSILRFDNQLHVADSVIDFEPYYFEPGYDSVLAWVVGRGRNPGLYRLQINKHDRQTLKVVDTHEFLPILFVEGDSVWCISNGFLRVYNNTSSRITDVLNIGNTSIRYISREKDGGLWIGTFGDGLYYYHKGILTKLPLDNNEYLKSINALQEDKYHNFWISTNNGLFQTPKQDLLDFVSGKQKNVLYLRYSQNNGFSSNEFNGRGNRTSIKFDNDILAFASLDGVVFFHPDSIKPVFPTHPIILDKIIIDGAVMQKKQDSIVRFAKDYHNIIFQLASAQVGHEGSIQYEYNLNNNGWVKMKVDYVEFNELPAGKNVIQFRKLIGFEEQYNYLTIPFEVEAHWWQTVYFWIIIITFLLFFLWLFTKLRTQVLTRINKELTANVVERTQILNHKNMQLQMSEEELKQQLEAQISINETITHDIKTPLKYMAIYIRKIKENMLQNQTPKIEEIEALMTSVNSIYNFTASITTNIKSNVKGKVLSKVSMHTMIDEMIKLFQNAIEERELTILNQIEADMVFTTGNNTLKTIIHNLLDNAIKNNRQSEIVLSALNEIEDFQFFISSKNKINEDSLEKYNQYFQAADGIDGIKSDLVLKRLKVLLRR